MAYGVRYEARFTNAAGNQYAVQLLQKDYSGDIGEVLLAGNPVRHAWQTDEPKAPIKGSSLILTLINPGGEVATNTFSASAYPIYDPMGSSYLILTGTAFVPEVGIPFTISGHSDPLINTTFTPTSILPTGVDSYFVYVAPGEITNFSSPSAVTITRSGTIPSGALPITTFYSPNDDEWKIRFFREPSPLAIKLFEGFLVQDDCSELMADYIHEIVLSFTDNLGLLKDISLSANVPDFGGYPATAKFVFDSGTSECFIFLYNTDFIPAVGVPFTISRDVFGGGNGTWTPTAVTPLGRGNWNVQVANLSFLDIQAYPVLIDGAATINLYNRNTLLDIIRVCLYNTGLELNTLVYANIFETDNTVDDSFLAQTYVDAQTFIKSESFMDCYEVLTNILDRFNLTLFQSLGRWNIVRWDEARYGTIPFFLYDTDFIMQQTGDFDNFFTTGFEQDTYPENGLLRSIFRPYKFDKETFNYSQPKYLLLNFDLQDLGALRTSYVSGPNTIYEYELTDWDEGGAAPHPAFFIRVVKDTATDSEIERYVVVDGATGDSFLPVVSTPFEVNAGDKIEVALTFRTTVSQPGSVTIQFGVKLTDGSVVSFANEDPNNSWPVTAGASWTYTISSGGDTNTNQTVTINPGQIPYSGLIYIYLPQACLSSPTTGDETQIKDIRVTYTPFINDSTKIIGHVHNNEQTETIKNNEAVEIFVDDSPRNSVIGTLLKPSFTGLLQDRTSQWYRLTNPLETLRLGEITTLEQLFWRRVPRTKQEGTFYGITLVDEVLDISMLSILKNVAFNELNFVFGMLEIDYKNNNFNGTQWELYEDGETDGDLTSDYTFTYLYDSK